MHNSILDRRYTIKALPLEGRRPIELSSIMKPHPLSYMELPFDPEYSLYNNRMTPESLNNVTDDEQYWACLLYTSPSPRDRQKSRMPSSA